jgi:hypothetical protein
MTLMETTSLNDEGPHDNEIFVGRKELLSGVLESLERGSWEISYYKGLRGAGKSAFLRRLGVEVRGPIRVISLDMEKWGPQQTGVSVAALQANFTSFTNILRAFCTGLVADPVEKEALLDRLEVAIKNARNGVAKVRRPELKVVQKATYGEDATVDESPADFTANIGPVTITPGQLSDEWRKAAIGLGNVVVPWLNERLGDGTLLLLVDNIENYARNVSTSGMPEVGTWFLDLLHSIENTFVVLAGDAASPAPVGISREVSLPDLSQADVAEYLLIRLGRPSDARVTQQIYAFSGGNPAALGLICDVLLAEESREPADVLSALSHLPAERTETIAVLVQDMIAQLSDRKLDLVLKAACVLRRFGTPVLAAVLNGDSETDIPSQIEELESFSFTERVDDPDTREYALRVHPFVRTGLEERMRRYEPTLLRSFHSRAAKYYYDIVQADPSDDSGYSGWFRYEDPKWRVPLREWLYHSASISDDLDVRLHLARVFLDCEWWWGNYVPMDFCEEFVGDLQMLSRSTGSSDLSDMAAVFRGILDAYPARSIKPSDANWAAVRSEFETLQDLCGVLDEDNLDSEEKNHVAALISVFLAHTWRYSEPTSARGNEFYDAALRLFEHKDDAWNIAWIVFERADLTLEQGDHAGALEKSVEAADKIYAAYRNEVGKNKYLDDELVANTHRLRGDCQWLLGDPLSAARCYARAVLHAYRFHNTGGPPDEYTHQFYVEMRGRAITPAIYLWRNDRRQEAIQFAEELRNAILPFWKPPQESVLEELLSVGGAMELGLALFPRNPWAYELGLRRSEFMTEWRSVNSNLNVALRYDLL